MHLKVFLWLLYGQLYSKSSPATFSPCSSVLFKMKCSGTKVGQQGSIRRHKLKKNTNIIKSFFGKTALEGRDEGSKGKEKTERRKRETGRKTGWGGEDNQDETNQEEITVNSWITLHGEPLKF